MKQNYIKNKFSIKNIHATAKDISKIYREETIIPEWTAYLFWFCFLFLSNVWYVITK